MCHPPGALDGDPWDGVRLHPFLHGRLVSWLILGLAWKDRDVRFAPVVVVSAILLVVGLLFTFPPFFDLISGG